MTILVKPALLIVDVQNDFCPGGALAVTDGDKVVTPLNSLSRMFDEKVWPVFFSRDWHPEKTKHFQQFGGPWPTHCVQKTRGAEFHPNLWIPKGAYILNKGVDSDKNGYSAFEGTAFSCPFDELLREFGVNTLYIGGLATDYCVKDSALDAIKMGLRTCLLLDACRAVDLNPGDGDKAIRKMFDIGVTISNTTMALEALNATR